MNSAVVVITILVLSAVGLAVPAGILFSGTTDVTDSTTTRATTTTASTPSGKCVDGNYAPFEGDCSKYLQCGDGVWIIRQCPNPLIWDQSIKQCVFPGQAICVTTTSNIPTTTKTPAECEIGTYAPFVGDCTKFLQCDHGKWDTMQCPNHLIWDQELLSCIPNAVCDNSTTLDPDVSPSSEDYSGSLQSSWEEQDQDWNYVMP